MAAFEKEIESLKSAASSCKIIKNVGEFNFVITAEIPNTCASLKFQLAGRPIFVTLLLSLDKGKSFV